MSNTKEIKNLFEKINKAISKNKDTQAFNVFLQNHPDIIGEYENIDNFKRKVWIKCVVPFIINRSIVIMHYGQ